MRVQELGCHFQESIILQYLGDAANQATAQTTSIKPHRHGKQSGFSNHSSRFGNKGKSTQKNCFVGQTPTIQSYILTGTKNYTYRTWMSIIETLVLERRCRMVRSLPAVDSQWKNKGGRRKQSHLLSCLLKLQRRYAMG